MKLFALRQNFWVPFLLVSLSAAVTLFVLKGIPSQFSSQLPGASISDSGFMAGYFSTLQSSNVNPFSNQTNSLIGWPHGIKNHGSLNLTSSLSVGSVWLLGNLVGAIPAQLLTAIIGVFLSCFIGGLAVWSLTGSISSSILGTVSLGTTPMMMQWWSANPPYAQNWIYVLVLWSSCKIVRGDRYASVYLSLSTLFAVLWSQYVAAFCFIFCVVAMAYGMPIRQKLRSWVVVIAPSAFVVSAYYVIGRIETTQVPVRDRSDAALLALNVGKLFESDLAFYVPIAVVVLVLFGMSYISRSAEATDNRLLYLLLGQALALVLFFSAPRVGVFPLPGSLISGAVPQIRSGWYSAQPIQVALLILGCLLLAKLKTDTGVQRLLLAGLVVLAAIDNYRIPETEQIRWMQRSTTSEALVSELRSRPPGAVAHFPWELSNETSSHPEPTPCFFQRIHLHPIINTCGIVYSSNDTFPFVQQIRARSGCDQLSFLRSQGVRYVIVELSPLQPILMKCLDDQMQKKESLRLILDPQTGIELWELVQ